MIKIKLNLQNTKIHEPLCLKINIIKFSKVLQNEGAMNKFFFGIISTLFFYTQKTVAQTNFLEGVQLETAFHAGKIVKHTPKLVFDPPAQSLGIELHLGRRLTGQKRWHEWYHYPTFGVSLLYFDLGNPTVFGSAWAIYPTWDIKLFGIEKASAMLQIGSGIAYLSHHFDPLSNPTNNAVGSHINNITAFKINTQYIFSKQYAASAGFSFTHFSNGASQLPNYGINIAGGNFRLIYTPQPIESVKKWGLRATESTQKWGIALHADLAFVESTIYGGPRYPVKIFSMSATRKIFNANKLHLGLSYEENGAVADFGYYIGQYPDRETARRASSRLAVTVADELFLGNVSILLQSGYYVSKAWSWQLLGTWFNKLGLRYYTPPIGYPKTRFFAGIYLKAHKINAEYIALGFGAMH